MDLSNSGGPGTANQARLAAVWITHGRACAELLRAHGRTQQADNFDAALDALVDIVAVEVGRWELSRALAWARGTGPASADAPSPTRH